MFSLAIKLRTCVVDILYTPQWFVLFISHSSEHVKVRALNGEVQSVMPTDAIKL